MQCVYRRLPTTKTLDVPGETEVSVSKRAKELCEEGWELIQVGEVDVIGHCEACERPLLETDAYAVDEDLIRICETCFATHEWKEPEEHDPY
jgi:hypothetical protein